jgi:hypothetical protein
VQTLSGSKSKLFSGNFLVHFNIFKLSVHEKLCQAWEILALAMEKESDYKNAAGCYEKVLHFSLFTVMVVIS